MAFLSIMSRLLIFSLEISGVLGGLNLTQWFSKWAEF